MFRTCIILLAQTIYSLVSVCKFHASRPYDVISHLMTSHYGARSCSPNNNGQPTSIRQACIRAIPRTGNRKFILSGLTSAPARRVGADCIPHVREWDFPIWCTCGIPESFASQCVDTGKPAYKVKWTVPYLNAAIANLLHDQLDTPPKIMGGARK